MLVRSRSCSHGHVSKPRKKKSFVLLLGAVDYLALGDEAGFGGLPRGLPGRGVTEGEDGALGARRSGSGGSKRATVASGE
jgi:hypothetical protein